MSRSATLLVFCLALLQLHATAPLLTLENALLPSPAGVGASGPEFVTDKERLLLSWTEPSSNNALTRHFAYFDPQTRSWEKSPATEVARATALHQQNERGEITVSFGGRVAKAWFVLDKKDPRVLLSTSSDAGQQFLLPVRIEDSRPIGNPDLVLLSDGSVYVSWPEHYNQDETALWVRRVSPGGSLSVPVLLAVLPAGRPSPQLALVKDFDTKPAQLLVTYTVGKGDTSQIVTRLLTVDFATDARRTNPCLTCPDADEGARGYALKGRIVALSRENSTLTVQHSQLIGVLPATSTEFKVDPAVLKTAAVGNELFARIEKRGADWWLFSARLIVQP